MEKITLKIDGMSCGGCVRHVTQALAKVPGVKLEQVQVGSATVIVDPPIGTKQAVLQGLRDAGYEAAEVTGMK